MARHQIQIPNLKNRILFSKPESWVKKSFGLFQGQMIVA